LYKSEPALYENQFEPGGFEWIDLNHRSESVLVYIRKGKNAKDNVLIVLNITPIVRKDWEIYVHGKGLWQEIFNSNSEDFWGTGDVFNPIVNSILVDNPTLCYKLTLQLPALGALVLR
jgi:1,4-alpha-glucan branching enzyme